jgi:AhpD family alkylhydroperoxidase
MESQTEINEERNRIRDRLLQLVPDVMKPEMGQVELVYRDGALSKKMKRLIALGIALRACCTNCILAQTERSLEAGATIEEILETISVEISISGTTGVAESMRVIKFLEELGKI